jgi:hypothetical protein
LLVLEGMGNHVLRWAVLALALGGGDCRSSHSTKQGKFDLAMLDSDGLDAPWSPIATGTHIKISVSAASGGCGGGGHATFVQLASSAPSVATFTQPADSEIEANALSPGTAELQFLDASGKVIDTVAVDVAQIAAVDLKTVDQRVQVLGAFTYGLEVAVEDASGRELAVGPGRVTKQTTGLISANQTDTFTGAKLEVTATASGTLTVSADTASATLDVQTVLPRDITSIALGTGSWAPSYNPNNQTAVVWLTPMTPSGEVYGIPCSWEFDNNGGVVIMSDRSATDLTQPAYNNTQFYIDTPGPHTVTCVIGSAQLAVTLPR